MLHSMERVRKTSFIIKKLGWPLITSKLPICSSEIVQCIYVCITSKLPICSSEMVQCIETYDWCRSFSGGVWFGIEWIITTDWGSKQWYLLRSDWAAIKMGSYTTRTCTKCEGIPGKWWTPSSSLSNSRVSKRIYFLML